MTQDLDSTADVHEESTADLEPATADFEPSEAARPTLAGAQPKPAADRESKVSAVFNAGHLSARDVSAPAPLAEPIVARKAERSTGASASVANDEPIFAHTPTLAAAPFIREEPIISALPPAAPITALTVDGPPKAAAPDLASNTHDVSLDAIPAKRDQPAAEALAAKVAATVDVTPSITLPKQTFAREDASPVATPARTVDVPPTATSATRAVETLDVPLPRSAPTAQQSNTPPNASAATTTARQAVTTADIPVANPPPLLTNTADIAPAPRKSLLKAVQAPARRPALTPGTVLCDRYLLEQVIGCGGTAIVFRARDMLSAKGTAPNIQVAIKSPRPELGDPARATKRLKHEFEHARLLSHPSIVRVFDLHEDDGHAFMTMELVEGRLLSGLLRDWTMMPVPLAYKILHLCGEALSYAHSKNVVHGDFKPGNVFITRDEGVRIVDFGTAAGPSANDTRIPAGTPTYASPEVLSGETPDTRDDVFSFACVAYEVLTGQHPFGRQSSLQAREEGKIPPRAWNLSTSQWLSLLSALSWKREQRPTRIDELLTRLSPEQPMDASAAPVHVDPEEVVPAELPADLMPKQRSWGFFAFIACALVLAYFAFQRQNTSDEDGKPTPAIAPAIGPAIAPASATLPPTRAPTAAETKTESTTAEPEKQTTEVALPAEKAVPTATARPERAAAALSEISFETSTIVTSESSVAAVFVIKRSQPLRGRATVSWKAVSGTADAGIDFASSAAGTVTFADGQAQRAIYVPLRNDLLKEGDETFYVELLNPKSARLGKLARAEAIIRDDD